MLFYIPFFIVLVAFGVLSKATEDDFCAKGAHVHCFTPEIEPVKFPDSVEALDKICPVIIPEFKCLVDYKNKCGNQGKYDEKLNIFYDLIVEACDKKSEFHRELSTGLPCVEKVIMSHLNACQSIVEEAVEKIINDLSLERDEMGYLAEKDWEKSYCFYEAIDISCFATSTSVRCGEKTKDSVQKVLDRIGFLDVSCPANMREEVKATVEIVQPELEQKLTIGEFLSKI